MTLCLKQYEKFPQALDRHLLHRRLGAGGKAKDTRTEAQKRALRVLIAKLVKEYPIKEILGHRDTSPDTDGDGIVEPHEWTKMCPCFDAKEEYKDLLP